MLHHWRTAGILWYLQNRPTPHKERGRWFLLRMLQRKLPVSHAFRLVADPRNTNNNRQILCNRVHFCAKLECGSGPVGIVSAEKEQDDKAVLVLVQRGGGVGVPPRLCL